jgi:hypothetical protein
MLQTIEVQIDTNGYIHTVEPVMQLPAGRGLLTLLENTITTAKPKTKTQKSFDDLFGILTATHSVSLDDMERTIAQQGQERLNDCN